MHVMPLPGPLTFDFKIATSHAKSLPDVLKKGPTVQVFINTEARLAGFMVGDYEYTCKLGEEEFPPYEKVICENVAPVAVNAAKLEKSVKRLDSLMESAYHSLRLTVKRDIELAFTDYDGNEVSATVTTANGVGQVREPIGVDPDYLLDTLIGLGGTDEVEITVCGPLDLIRVDAADGRIAIVMPKRL